MTKRRVVSKTSRVDPDKVGKRAKAGTKRVYQGTIEAEWTCSSCGREHIPGGVKKCPSCGNPKDTSETYEAPTQKGDFLTDEELEDLGVDPDLHLSDEECPYCFSKLKPGTQKCPNCGAVLTDVGYATRICPACNRETNEARCPNCGAETLPKEESETRDHDKDALADAAVGTMSKPSTDKTFVDKVKEKLGNRSALIGIGSIIFTCLCLTVLLFWFLLPRTETATVSGLAWERKIEIQEYQYNLKGDWSLPSDADLESTEERIHHYDKVLVGYEEECGYEESCTSVSVYDHTETTCYDDGTCDEHDVYRTEQECEDEYVCEDVPQYEDDPAYQTWYNYYIWEWVDLKPLVASGKDAYPYWPEVNLKDDQREKPDGRHEECTVTFENKKGKTYDFDAPCADLEQYDLGSRWKIKRNLSKVIEVEPAR